MDMVPDLKTVVRKRFPLGAQLIEHYKRLKRGQIPIYLDYRVDPQPRYGWGKVPHETLYRIFDENRATYASFIERVGSFREDLRKIPCDAPDEFTPYWSNGYVTGVDALSLYLLTATLKPRL